jgi:Arm DNA-binding domain
MPLTDTEVRKSKPADKPYRLSDANSLFLWVTPAGGKLWRWAYEFDGREKLMSFGKYPPVTLAGARVRRDESRKMLANGIVPMAKRKQERQKNAPKRKAHSTT